MKLLGVRLARSVWLIPQYFLNPTGAFGRPIIEGLKTRYRFLKGPLDSLSNDPAEGAKFENGGFQSKKGDVHIVSLTLHSDGLVVEMRSSTEDGDAFLEDAINWASEEFGLPPVAELPFKRIYVSELNVVFSKTPKFFSSNVVSFIKGASLTLGDKKTGKPDFVGFIIGSNPANSEKQVLFRFEREINTSFEENRYYSFASIPTSAHLKLIERLEKLTS